MKNPFNEPARESWFCGTWDLSDREFCAHAINQHEKLVAMLGKQQRIMMTFCGCCGGNPCRPDCELDAQLKEEKP